MKSLQTNLCQEIILPSPQRRQYKRVYTVSVAYPHLIAIGCTTREPEENEYTDMKRAQYEQYKIWLDVEKTPRRIEKLKNKMRKIEEMYPYVLI